MLPSACGWSGDTWTRRVHFDCMVEVDTGYTYIAIPIATCMQHVLALFNTCMVASYLHVKTSYLQFYPQELCTSHVAQLAHQGFACNKEQIILP